MHLFRAGGSNLLRRKTRVSPRCIAFSVARTLAYEQLEPVTREQKQRRTKTIGTASVIKKANERGALVNVSFLPFASEKTCVVKFAIRKLRDQVINQMEINDRSECGDRGEQDRG